MSLKIILLASPIAFIVGLIGYFAFMRFVLRKDTSYKERPKRMLAPFLFHLTAFLVVLMFSPASWVLWVVRVVYGLHMGIMITMPKPFTFVVPFMVYFGFMVWSFLT